MVPKRGWAAATLHPHAEKTELISTAALAIALSLASPTEAAPPDDPTQLSDIVVTARRRNETALSAPLSVTAVSGDDLRRDRILTLEDLTHEQTGISFSADSPQALDINIRGVVNTRLTAPTADQSVALFVDDVYVNRSGTMDSSFYDVGRIEIIRGPQGVVLGKNVSGGAVSVVNNPPSFDASQAFTATAGNYGLRQAEGYITGPLSDSTAGRLSIQALHHDGYARDLLHGVDLENLDSLQARSQILYRRADGRFSAQFIVDASHEKTDGIDRVGVKSDTLPAGPDIWSGTRSLISEATGRELSIRESFPAWPLFAGDDHPTPQRAEHTTFSAIAKIEDELSDRTRLTSITGFRTGRAFTLYDQSGLGPSNGFDFSAQQLAGVGSSLLFAEPQNFREKNDILTEDLRLASTSRDGAWEWLVGAYFLQSRVAQHNRYWGESLVLPTLSGESHWNDAATNRDVAVFGQAAVRLPHHLKIEAGLRYTWDRKSGAQQGVVIATGDVFHPSDAAPLTPLTGSFQTPYQASWSRLTPQGTLQWTPNPRMTAYATVSAGFKGGGFENNAPNAFAARTPYDPEEVTNYELGAKAETPTHHLDGSVSVFRMNYKNLQVQETSAACLCAIISNAASASIAGTEIAAGSSLLHNVRIWTSASYLDATYDRFVLAGVDNSGHRLQRTPKWQAAVGADVTADAFGWKDALTARLSYHYQGRMPWAPENTSWEAAYGTLDGRVTLSTPDGRWSVSVWAKNLADRAYRTNVIVFFNDEVSSYGQPRTIGVDLGGRF